MYSKILVPLDGSKPAEKVLPYARYLAGRFKVPVELLAVVDIAEMASHMVSEKGRFLDTIIEDGVRQCTSYLSGVATTFADLDVRCSVEKGKAEDTIIEKAATDKAMLITMATHGRLGSNRFLLGSVAEKVLRGSVNPLLLIRATGEAKSENEAISSRSWCLGRVRACRGRAADGCRCGEETRSGGRVVPRLSHSVQRLCRRRGFLRR